MGDFMTNAEVMFEDYEKYYKIGMEFAGDGLSPDRFKSESPEQLKAFLEGYKAGLEMQKENTLNNDIPKM